MFVVRGKIERPASAQEILVRVNRASLSKRRWRAVADDGTEFGFDLGEPLRHGDCIHATDSTAYVLEQQPEPVLQIPLPADPSQAAIIAWHAGNLHCPMELTPTHLRLADGPAIRNGLRALGIAFEEIVAVFKPVRASGAHEHEHHH